MNSSSILHPSRRILKNPLTGALLAALLLVTGMRRATALEYTAEERQLAERLTTAQGQRRDRARMHADPILSAVAHARAEDMAKRRYFAHVSPEGLGPNYLVRSAGYTLPTSWGGRSTNFIESIGAGYANAEQAWEGWMNSPSHRTHLLASHSFYRDQTNFGIGSYSDPASPFRRYWVIITAPPAVRSETAYVSRRTAKPARVAVAMPIFSNVDPDEGEVADVMPESAPRPSVSTPPTIPSVSSTAPASVPAPPRALSPTTGEPLWNWEGQVSVSAPRPAATKISGQR